MLRRLEQQKEEDRASDLTIFAYDTVYVSRAPGTRESSSFRCTPSFDRYSETKQLFLQPRDKRTTPVGSILRLYLRSLVYELVDI